MTIKKNPQASALSDAESLSSAAVQEKGTAQAQGWASGLPLEAA